MDATTSKVFHMALMTREYRIVARDDGDRWTVLWRPDFEEAMTAAAPFKVARVFDPEGCEVCSFGEMFGTVPVDPIDPRPDAVISDARLANCIDLVSSVLTEVGRTDAMDALVDVCRFIVSKGAV